MYVKLEDIDITIMYTAHRTFHCTLNLYTRDELMYLGSARMEHLLRTAQTTCLENVISNIESYPKDCYTDKTLHITVKKKRLVSILMY